MPISKTAGSLLSSKFNNGNIGAICQIYPKLTIQMLE